MSSRAMTKREPSPAPSRPSSLRQSIPTKQAPQLVNGKAEAPAGGRTRSAARNSMHTPPVASSSHSAPSNTQNATGNTVSHGESSLQQQSNKLLHLIMVCNFLFPLESTRLLRGHSSSSTPPAPEKVTASPTMESNSGGSTRRKVKPPVRHLPGKDIFVSLSLRLKIGIIALLFHSPQVLQKAHHLRTLST